ncbi:RluA family pseudouridine synthase [Mesoplasma lactucae]|uniref:Pseudouridine synthase n=1 Tax=Mesoplasma lactucae ATCC 49193 TaxID=81460 RepID=A0A291IS07_9MOLU|nr:RluA family pseudouridine synthase [Mesoplasma lactucae]ATG97477.1 RNA pseudouridine synthase [Mesoplasma lactucae ATCC 49193]ATZ20068.1 23S rRNA pseudouridine1911/1915/1917 synthase [Mesoplasma lactucae ATCC 49193]MCL8216816.1 Ribosomal large subunit pseudouridine synthase D [Mesoplasma lactucae ATCC 49193]
MEKVIKVEGLNKEERIDKFLVDNLKTEFDFSRSYVKKMIDNGNVMVNGETANPNFKVKNDDEITITIPEIASSEIVAEDIPLNIVYEDDDILVVDKPNDMVVHPAPGNYSGTMVNALMHHVKDLSGIGGVERPGIVHRIDKQTTGLLIVAKTDRAHKKLTEMLKNNEIEKEYIALVAGEIDPDEAIIDAPIGRSETDRKKMMVTGKNSKPAVTRFKVMERFNNATEVSVKIDTGRTHQIRVHFKYINHPVLNDPQYGRMREKATDYGQYLHAHKLTFNHPVTGEKMEFTSELPQEFKTKIEELRKGE